MKRKTQCLAFAGKCVGFAAKGEVAARALSARTPLLVSKSIRASPAKPPPACHRNSRRVCPHGVRLGMKRSISSYQSLRIKELIQIQNDSAHLLQRDFLRVGVRKRLILFLTLG